MIDQLSDLMSIWRLPHYGPVMLRGFKKEQWFLHNSCILYVHNCNYMEWDSFYRSQPMCLRFSTTCVQLLYKSYFSLKRKSFWVKKIIESHFDLIGCTFGKWFFIPMSLLSYLLLISLNYTNQTFSYRSFGLQKKLYRKKTIVLDLLQ
jgi:hypothetical protein